MKKAGSWRPLARFAAALCLFAGLMQTVDARAASPASDPAFLLTRSFAEQLAGSPASAEVKAQFAARFKALSDREAQLTRTYAEVEAGRCVDACLAAYRSETESWQRDLQTFGADALASAPEKAQTPDALFLLTQALAGQIAAAAAPEKAKAEFARRFEPLEAEQKRLWQKAGDVDAGRCAGDCLKQYQAERDRWRAALLAYSTDASALAQSEAREAQ